MRLYLRSARKPKKFFRELRHYVLVRSAEYRERHLAKMRLRLKKQRKQQQAEHNLRIHPHRETILRNREAAKVLTPERRKAERRERDSFNRIGWFLKRQAKALALERYVTAMFGCPTSWPRIEAHAIYAVVAETT
jgi:hypothetical protein